MLNLSVPRVEAPKRGTLVMFGSTNWADIGKKVGSMLTSTDETPNLMSPHRLLAGLGKVRLAFVATSGTCAHVVALGVDGEAFAWGRNEAGQLGVGDLKLRAEPTRVAALSGKPISCASTGKAHTLFVSRDGELLATGACKQGTCGPTVPKKAEYVYEPVSVAAGTRFAYVASGSNFNLAIDADGDVWSWGWSEHGVLGNGTDHQHNSREGTIKLTYEAVATPARVSRLASAGCVHVACGTHHCAAVDRDGLVYTWGNGGYGRLGHKDQTDLHTPKPLEECRGRQVCCGSAHTAILGWPVLRNGVVCTGAPSLFMCGRVKSATQNAWMYPKPEEELRGWNVHALSVGNVHNVVHADESVISWGSGCSCGELGLEGKKSSANPMKVDALEGVSVAQLACGHASTIMLVEANPLVDKLPVFTPSAAAAGAEEDDEDEEEPAKKGKGKGKAAAKGTGKAAAKRPAEPAASGKAKKAK